MNNKVFCKYVTAEVAFKTLNTLTVKCSSPLLFNDPFDSLLEIRYDFSIEEVPELMFKRFHQIIFSDEKYKFDPQLPNYEKFKQIHENRDLNNKELRFKDIAPYLSGMVEGARKMYKQFNMDWRNFLKDVRALCLAENNNNILMWAHYSEGHTGAVIEFKCVPEVDSAFCAANRVIYSDEKPTLGSFEDFFDNIFGCRKIDYEKIHYKYTHTKSTHWSYEKEWRFFLEKQSEDGELFDFRSFLAEEINAIYLGDKIKAYHRSEIIELIKRRLPHVKIFKASLDPIKYKLNFDRVN